MTGQADKVAGHGVDLHRLAHIQNEYLAALGVVSRLQHQRHRFGDGHKEAGDLRVRHRYRAALSDLLFEQGDDAAVAAQHVAEAHRHEVRIGAAAVHHLHHHLAQALRGAHDVGGIHRLIRGDQHELLHAVLHRGHGHFIGAEDVVLDGLVGAVLHQGDVLVGGGVEHQLRSVLGHDVVQTAHVPHGADEHLQIQLRMGVAQLHLDIVGVVFVDIEDDQLFGVAFGDLAAQLAADGTTAAGDHHHLAGDIPADLLQIHLNRVTAQQILQLHVPELADTDLAVDQLEHPRHRLHPAAGLAADVQNLLAVLSVAGGDGEDDLIDLVLLHRIGDLLPPAGDLYTVQIPAALAGVVVDDAHHPAAQPGIGIDQLASGLAGADHQNAVPLALLRADPRHQLAHESVGEPQRRGGHEAHDKARKVEGSGHIDLQDQHIGQSGCQQHAIGQNDAEQLVDADKAPDAVIQPE